MARLWPDMLGLERLEQRPLARFFAVGSLVTLIDFAVFNLLISALADPPRPYVLLANTIAFATAASLGYQLHARYTFRADRDWSSFTRYGLVALAGVAIYDLGLFLIMIPLDPRNLLELNVAKVGAVGVAAMWNFQGFRVFTFRRSVHSRRGDSAS